MISVIIPHRVDQYLNKTIEDLLNKAKGDIEVIVVADGVWPSKIINDKRVRYIHQGTIHNSQGMREAINKGMAIARGDYVMKIDEHCSVSEGFDLEIAKIYETNVEERKHWVIIPLRKRLDADNWKILEDGRPDISYMYIEFPFLKPFDSTQGLHGNEWRQRHYDRKDILIDDTPSMQGSCWIMTKAHWNEVIKEMETDKYGPFTQEAQEIGFKTWFTGGRVIVDKNMWYAHLHKGRKGKGYGFSSKQYEVFMAAKEKGRQFAIDYWLNTKDYKYDWEWFVNHFPDMPGWEGDWKARLEQDKLKDFRYSPDYTTWKAH